LGWPTHAHAEALRFPIDLGWSEAEIPPAMICYRDVGGSFLTPAYGPAPVLLYFLNPFSRVRSRMQAVVGAEG
jgi:hypothetical protein